MKQEERDRHKKIRQDIKESTIPEELKVLYLMANATDIMCNMTFNRIKAVFAKNGYKIKENELLTGISQYCECVKRSQYLFFDRIEPQICNATWGMDRDEDNPDAPGNGDAYTQFSRDGNELCRLVMLYIDRCAKDNSAFAKVFKTLRQMPSGGLFKDEDISKYKMR